MPICPECHSRDLVRFGKYEDKQKWHCWSCGLTTIHVLHRMARRAEVMPVGTIAAKAAQLQSIGAVSC